MDKNRQAEALQQEEALQKEEARRIQHDLKLTTETSGIEKPLCTQKQNTLSFQDTTSLSSCQDKEKRS